MGSGSWGGMMQKRRRKCAGGIFVAAMAGLLLILTGCDEYGGAAFREERSEQVSVEAVSPMLLDADSSNGHVSIIGDEAATGVTVVATLRATGDSEQEAEDRLGRIIYLVERQSDRVRILYEADAQDDDVRRHASVDFDITVPTVCDVIADTSNGAITLEATTGTADLETSNGAIDVYGVFGDLLLDTSNGRIDVSHVEGAIDADTSNGEIWIHRTLGPVIADTSNGSIRFEGTLVGRDNSLTTGNGSVTLAIAEDASISIDASTTIGSISSRLPLDGDTEGRDWTATLNAPADVAVRLKTTNGSIRIEAI
ncbi:DUF4097 family beta strand repeat protein [Candidatus Bipolaricaulota bacterium]|nr:DUF4097 family beta strand repeat protein [Candidatus Bipolaricaulota bacterium]